MKWRSGAANNYPTLDAVRVKGPAERHGIVLDIAGFFVIVGVLVGFGWML